MRRKRKPPEQRKPEDYMEAADNALELAKALAGQGGISDQDFLKRMARSDIRQSRRSCEAHRFERGQGALERIR